MSGEVAADQNADGTLNLMVGAPMHEIGLGTGSPDSWAAYPMLSPFVREILDTIMSPVSYKALHYHSDSFVHIYTIPQLQFDQLPIFKGIGNIHLFGVVEGVGERARYAGVFEYAKTVVAMTHTAVVQNVQNDRMQDLNPFTNMAFAFFAEMDEEANDATQHRLAIKGFHPYFNVNDDNLLQESMFFYFHATLNRIVMAAAPSAADATQFMLTTGAIHTFDKLCAFCGKTGGLLKCPCKAVRYCGDLCQRRHWPAHAVECRARRARVAAVPA